MVTVVGALVIALTIVTGVIGSCFAKLGFEAEVCNLPEEALKSTVSTLAGLGLSGLGTAATAIGTLVVDFIINALPGYAAKFLGVVRASIPPRQPGPGSPLWVPNVA